MAGVMFPDFLGAIGKASAIEANQAQRDWMDEDRAAKKAAGALVPAALGGDRDALGKIGTLHPDTAMKIAPLLERADAATRARAKEASEWTTKAAMGVLSLPEAERPAAYQAALADGQRLGYKIDMPPQYDRAVEGRLRMVVNQAQSVSDFLKGQDGGFDLVLPGGGGGGGGAAPPNRDAFVQTMMPHALEVSKATGLDPRLVIAQAALETGYGQSAPGNNLFGVKSHGKPGGQVLATKEAGPGGMYGTRESFRTYSNPGESARDYVDFLKTNSRYAPVLQAQGIDAQIEAMGRSGYASDPQYAAKLRQIVQSLPQPPGIAQGDAAPRGDASGNPIPTSDGGTVPREVMRMITPNLPPGANLGRDRKTGKFMVQEGSFVVYDDNKNPIGLYPIPKAPGADKGLFGDSLTGRALAALRSLPPDSQEYAAAYAILSKPQVVPDGAGGFTTIQPMNLSMFPKPTFAGGAFVEPPPGGGPAPTQVGGVTVQSIPGRGKPLDNSARDELTKASGGVLELTELVKSFDPSFGGFLYGPLGEADNARKRNLPDMLGGKDEKGQAQWWQRYQQFANLERNKLFGAALTPGEAAEFNKAMINPGMKPEQITANLARQRDIATKALSRIVNSMVAGGYNPQAIEAATGISVGELPSPMGGVPQASPAPAAAPAPAPTPQQQPAPQTPRGADRGKLLFDARDAIAKGAPRDKVIERLRSMGIEDEP